MKEQLESDNYKLVVGEESYEVTPAMVTKITKVSKTEHVREFVPSVVEPSFGIGRILYCILECNFKVKWMSSLSKFHWFLLYNYFLQVRESDEKRTWLDLPPLIAPTKCSVLPLSTSPDFVPYIEKLSAQLRKLGIPCKVDDSSGSIGRRYTRTDEIGIPFGITVDFDTVKLDTVTVRDRNTCTQVWFPSDTAGKTEKFINFISSSDSSSSFWNGGFDQQTVYKSDVVEWGQDHLPWVYLSRNTISFTTYVL